MQLEQSKKKIATEFMNCKDYFYLLGDEMRIKIICLLLENKCGTLSVEKITDNMCLSRPAVSHHLKILNDAGIICRKKESRYSYYYLNKETSIWKELCSFFQNVDNLLHEIK